MGCIPACCCAAALAAACVAPGRARALDDGTAMPGEPAAVRTVDLAPRSFDLSPLSWPGTLTQSARLSYAGAQTNLLRSTVRLDTTLVHDRAGATWRAGDFVASPDLSGIRPVRLGGLQWQGRLGAASGLGEGALAYSLGTGYLRRAYGVASASYDAHPAALATVRAGVTDWLVLEGHTERAADLANGGLGLTARLGDFGVLSGAAEQGAGGARWSEAWRLSRDGLQLRAAHAVSSGGYRTLAGRQEGAPPPRRRAEFTMAGEALGGRFSIGYSRCDPAPVAGAAPAASVGTMAWSTRLPRRWTLKTSTSRDFAQAIVGGSLALSHPFL